MGARRGSADGDELDILARLVDAYDAKHHVIDAPDPVTAIGDEAAEHGAPVGCYFVAAAWMCFM